MAASKTIERDIGLLASSKTHDSPSAGNMHSIRNSCAVTHCGVPAVVISEKYENRLPAFTNVGDRTGLCAFGIRLSSFTPGFAQFTTFSQDAKDNGILEEKVWYPRKRRTPD